MREHVREVELGSIEDYIAESDNLVAHPLRPPPPWR
jgi:hypothetical protein